MEALTWWSFWIAIAALVVAIVAAVTAFQMFFGKPKIKTLSNSKLGYELIYLVNHVPPNKFLLSVGVDRRIMDIDYTGSIVRKSDNKLVSFIEYPSISSKHVVIPVAGAKGRDNGVVHIKDPFNQYPGTLDVGLYTFELEIWDVKDRYQVTKKQRQFSVNANPPFVEWIGKEKRVKTENNQT